MVAIGCSPERKHKVLSFFFDGVPDPNAPVETGLTTTDAEGKTVPMRPIISRHKPYAEGKCDSCHAGSSGAMEPTAVGSSQCGNCHKDVGAQYKYVHGPVASGECLWCHDAHEARYEHLMKDDIATVCGQCHDLNLLNADVPAHAQPSAEDCTTCHGGHGGPDVAMLKMPRSAMPGMAPSTQPDRGPQ